MELHNVSLDHHHHHWSTMDFETPCATKLNLWFNVRGLLERIPSSCSQDSLVSNYEICRSSHCHQIKLSLVNQIYINLSIYIYIYLMQLKMKIVTCGDNKGLSSVIEMGFCPRQHPHTSKLQVKLIISLGEFKLLIKYLMSLKG